jgi:hypothetical protein
MQYLPILILIGILVLTFMVETKNTSPSNLFTKIYLATLVLGLFLAPMPILLLILFSPILAWPVYSCWKKPNNTFLWRPVSVVFLILSYKFPTYISIKFGASLDLIVGPILTSLLIMLPLIIASFIEIKYRLKN